MDGFFMSKAPRKIIMMGLAEAGKTTIYKVALGGKNPEDLKQYDATLEYTREIRQVASETMAVFDVGGQESFLEKFTGEMAQVIFSNLDVLLYVIDISHLEILPRSKFYFDRAISQLRKYSPSAKVAVFLHKSDTISKENRENVMQLVQEFMLSDIGSDINVGVYITSIYDDSLFMALGELFSDFILKKDLVEESLRQFLVMRDALRVAIYTKEGIPLHEVNQRAVNLRLMDKHFLRSLQSIFTEVEGIDEFASSFTIGKEHNLVILPLRNGSYLSVVIRRAQSLQETLQVVYGLREQVNQFF